MTSTRPSLAQRLLPANADARRLLPMVCIQAIGFGLLTTFGAIYYTRVLGFSVAQVGIAMSIATLLGLIVGVPVGHLADRRGPRGLLILLLALQALAVLAFLVVGSYASFLVVLSLWSLVDRAASAVRGGLVAKLVPAGEQAVTRSYFRALSNVGFALGAGVVGAALWLDDKQIYRALLGAASLGYALAAASLTTCRPVAPVPRSERLGMTTALRDRRYLAFCALNAGLTFHYSVLEVAMPLWIVQNTSAPPVLVTAMFLLNTVLVTTCQVRVGRSADTLEGARQAALVSGAVLAASCLLFGLSGYFATAVAIVALILAGATLAFGEMMQTAASWTLAYELAPANGHGQYQGLFSTSTSAGLMLGASVVTLLVINNGLPGWLALATMFVVCGFATSRLVSRHASRPAQEAAATAT